MEKKLINQLEFGIRTSFINREITSDPFLRPQLISNDYKQGKKMLTALTEELSKCDEFYISVAFISMGGITPLLLVLKELEQRGVKGKILTTDYLTFSDPKALEKLHAFKNLEIKMYLSNNDKEGFHTKGYIFKNQEQNALRIIIGSSNITLNALTINKEWNTKIVSNNHGEYAVTILDEFHKLWNSSQAKPFDEFFDDYEKKYWMVQDQKALVRTSKLPRLDNYKLEPNTMQVQFTQSIQKLVQENERKALLISATGTGKTFASAFAIRDLNPKRMLFLVHREQIARQARESYQRVFGDHIGMGLISGSSKDTQSPFIFSTMQMMAKREIHSMFHPNEFDVIVIDEVHRAGSTSYQTIMDYFKPRFYLGMTASPERMDGFDIYQMFDHNIAHEIRLQEALEEDLLCPFHYFGITEFQEAEAQINYEFRDFLDLDQDKRVQYIIDKLEYFGFSGDRVKGLIFCSTKEDATALSDQLNKKGYQTLALTGNDSQEDRLDAIERLTGDAGENHLDYIITVDIFNEGVDIPEINQVVMLRPTQSPIIFVQQLGRGLRKYQDKEYVVIIDFIGNYNNNYLIPMALFGDRSYNKDNVRRFIREGNKVIPGSSSIHFDEITKKRIYETIDSANFSESKIIKQAYQQLKFKLGRIPTLMDFEEHGSIDVLRIFENKTYRSYYGFLIKCETEYHERLDSVQINMLEFISQKLASGKRIHELIVLKSILEGISDPMHFLEDQLVSKYSLPYTNNTERNVMNYLSGEFFAGTGKDTFKQSIFLQKNSITGRIEISDQMETALKSDEFRRLAQELIDYGFFRNQMEYSNYYKNTPLNLYAKYTYEDVCRILEWEKAEVAQNIGGYKFDRETKTFPVFINYLKENDIADSINYEDRFLSTDSLIALSKSRRTIDSNDVKTLLTADQLGVRVELFVRKNKDDKASKEFYYLGRIHATGQTESIIMPNTNQNAVEIYYQLETPVREDLYEYIVN